MSRSGSAIQASEIVQQLECEGLWWQCWRLGGWFSRLLWCCEVIYQLLLGCLPVYQGIMEGLVTDGNLVTSGGYVYLPASHAGSQGGLAGPVPGLLIRDGPMLWAKKCVLL